MTRAINILLEEAKSQVTEFRQLVQNFNNRIVTFDVGDGKRGEAIIIEHTPVYMIMEAFFEEGSIFQNHFHEKENEYFIMVDGELSIQIDNKSHIYRKGDSFHVPPKACHAGVYTKDSNLLIISIPPLELGDANGNGKPN